MAAALNLAVVRVVKTVAPRSATVQRIFARGLVNVLVVSDAARNCGAFRNGRADVEIRSA